MQKQVIFTLMYPLDRPIILCCLIMSGAREDVNATDILLCSHCC